MMSQNASDLGHNLTWDPRKTYETALASTFLILTILTAAIGNTGVIAVICMYRSLRSDISNFLIINLSVTDLINTVCIMLSALVSILTDKWTLGTVWCDFICALNYCLIIVSMLTLCCISIDRYQAVMHPFSYQSRITKKRLLIVIVYTWLQGMAFGIVPSALKWVAYDYWEAICAIQWHLHRPSSLIYVILAFILCFLGPGIVLVYCYSKILKEVNKQKVQVLAMEMDAKATHKANRKMSDKSRLVWSLLVVVFAYFICTTPFSVTKLIKVSVDKTDYIPGPVNLVSSLLGYVASAINPLIYGIFRRDFRSAYKRLLKRICIRLCSELDIFQTENTSRSRPGNSDLFNVTAHKTGNELIDTDSGIGKEDLDKSTARNETKAVTKNMYVSDNQTSSLKRKYQDGSQPHTENDTDWHEEVSKLAENTIYHNDTDWDVEVSKLADNTIYHNAIHCQHIQVQAVPENDSTEK